VGGTLQDQMNCYSLPYGGIGFASHILTYITLLALWHGISVVTWKRLNWSRFDLSIAILTIVGSIALTIITIIRCRSRWQFMVIAIWKALLSTCLGFTALTETIRARMRERNIKRKGADTYIELQEARRRNAYLGDVDQTPSECTPLSSLR
jgi:hypothetical protein